METKTEGRDGSVTVISDGYGFGSITVGPPLRPEPTRVEPRRLTRAELLKKFRSADRDLEVAERFGLPTAARRAERGSFTLTPIWREDLLDRWADEQRAKATDMLRLVGPATTAKR